MPTSTLPSMAGAKAAPSDADVKEAERAKVRGKVAWLDAFFEYLSTRSGRCSACCSAPR
ncbi:MAG: hypothetical protein R2719_03745 [Micropruina sp.]